MNVCIIQLLFVLALVPGTINLLCLSLSSCLNMSLRSSLHSYPFMRVYEYVFVLRSINKPARFNSFVPSVGRALPSHYSGSTTSLRLHASVSHNLSLFSPLSLVIFLFHSLRQLPSPSGTQYTLITFCFFTLSPLLSCLFCLT